MDKFIKLNSQTAGRDKLLRLFQYSSKLIWGSLQNKKSNAELIKLLKELEYTLSTGRKLFRFGKGFETFYTALASLHISDPTLQFTITLSRINMGLYLLTDHFIWLERVGLLKIDKTKWSKLSYRLWLYALVMNLSRDLYDLKQIFHQLSFGTLNQELQGKIIHPPNTISTKLNLYFRVLALHKDIVLDTIKNGCDICLPLSQLGYLSISPRTIGLLGTVSSIAGIIPLIDSSYKLSP
ncbi:peroxisomal membrane protein 11B-like [Argiope bruennichi]|uniref:Peroxisomal membrane protein 11B like protein n=1 Tax=Argiope bruennichi TaxID=94029 RepID=A0A8T0EH49_ARGBR|nr:peroxisomal membrane protein 11B-like [Argiope bruennichi]KAF8772037.1 Peroxisomal membrane protein 11B like protein [Argiope bruennichi]